MDELRKQVRRAQRRITMQRFAGVLGWCWFSALFLALIIVVVDKYHPLPVQSWIWFAGAVALGLVGAVIWTALGRGPMLEAAMEIDRRFALKERVSSVLAMPPEDLQSEAGRAVTRRCPQTRKTHRRCREIRGNPAAETFPAFGPGLCGACRGVVCQSIAV